jgi:chromosome segregation ATPase
MASKSNGRPEANDAIPSSSLQSEETSQTNGKTTPPRALENDIATLTTLLESVQASAQTPVVDDEQSEKELEELLRQMDEASELADGIEGRVDALLADLESILGSLDLNASDDKEVDAHGSSRNASADAREVVPEPSDHPNRQAGG